MSPCWIRRLYELIIFWRAFNKLSDYPYYRNGHEYKLKPKNKNKTPECDRNV